ncbi:hypothetical protein V6N13_072051 [Hibiscus sabdariffa]
MSEPLDDSGQFYPSAPMFQTSVPPLAVYPPPSPDFSFNYGMVQHIVPSGTSPCDNDEDEEEAETVRKNPRRNCHPPHCGIGGHRTHKLDLNLLLHWT